MSETRVPRGGAMDEPAGLPAAGPVTVAERITAIDTLRGVAVLGILVMNVYAFAMPFAAYTNPLIMGGEEWYNLGTWFFTHLLFDQKFMTIFSMLFGAGVVLMAGRAEERGVGFAGIFYRRQLWLLLIGVAHGYLLWFGDILFHYALVGMLLYPLRHRAPRTLIVVACLLLPVSLLMNYAGAEYMEEEQAATRPLQEQRDAGEALTAEEEARLEAAEAMRSFVAPTAEDVQADLEAYRGSYGEIVEHRAPMVASMQFQGAIAFALWRVGGLMLIGMALMKLGVLSARRSPAFYRRMMIVGYGLGLPLAAFSGWNLWQHEFDGLYAFRVGMIPNYFASILVAFGHVGLVMRIVQSGALAALMRRFAAVGRMALTNYLMHSLILTTVFYGYGFGLYGTVPRFWQMAFVAAVIGLQLWLSPIWLRNFRFGPVEWLWRSLTYWRRQPLKS
ncbi:DUF418 domain-containing protein [Lentisalinibacter salinarum]|uniref:DUF418 domain-containing protein n=1 Tax=Lentisalinibacter salinarum TaxID=2992239 RepID=UPI0038706AE5